MSKLLTYIGHLRESEPTVIFIPGAMTSPCVFDGLANYLPCQSAVIDWNNSEGAWEVEEIARKVLELIRKLHLGKTLLCGYSMGGVISLSAAIQDQENLVAGLFIADTGASAVNHGDMNFPQTLSRCWPDEEVFYTFLKRCFAKPISRGLYLKLWDYAVALKRETVVQAATSVRATDLRDRLDQITCPVLLIHGVEDQSRSVEHARELERKIADIEVIWFHCGHTPMVEEHERYLDKLLYFIEKLQLTAGSGSDVLSVIKAKCV